MGRWAHKSLRLSETERFWFKVDKTDDGCWEWRGTVQRGAWGDYGCFRRSNNKKVKAHRFAWELENGPIGEGLHVHHKCGNTLCVRPDHLQAVTPRIHAVELTPGNLGYRAARVTHCPSGHPYDEENTRRCRGRRYCRACHRRHEYERRAREREDRARQKEVL